MIRKLLLSEAVFGVVAGAVVMGVIHIIGALITAPKNKSGDAEVRKHHREMERLLGQIVAGAGTPEKYHYANGNLKELLGNAIDMYREY
jgi:hypothetical protein